MPAERCGHECMGLFRVCFLSKKTISRIWLRSSGAFCPRVRPKTEIPFPNLEISREGKPTNQRSFGGMLINGFGGLASQAACDDRLRQAVKYFRTSRSTAYLGIKFTGTNASPGARRLRTRLVHVCRALSFKSGRTDIGGLAKPGLSRV